MRAVVQKHLGGTDGLEVIEIDRPEPELGEVLIKVRGIGLNPADWKAGESGLPVGTAPYIPGWDVAGVVEEVGFGVTLFAPGDRVFGMIGFPREGATCAEYVTSPSRVLSHIPDGVDDIHAAALPLAGLTAWQTLVETAHVTAGTRVLILAASGGVGSLAVQVAKSHGAWVAGTGSERNRDYVLSLGADEYHDYHGDISASVSDVDVVLDLAGGGDGVSAVQCVKDGGIIITVPNGQQDLTPIRAAAGDRIRSTAFLVEPDDAGMDSIASLAGAGKLTATIAKTFPLSGTAAAQDAVREGAGGRVVITVGN